MPAGHRVVYPTSSAASGDRSERELFAGIRVGRSDRPDAADRSVRFQHNWVAVPIVYLLLPAALVPSVRLARYLRRRRTARPAGRCRHCGHALTGNAGGVCPECGQGR